MAGGGREDAGKRPWRAKGEVRERPRRGHGDGMRGMSEGCQKLPRRVRERQERGHGERERPERSTKRPAECKRGKRDTEETRKRPERVP
jgi:hypothetical protein